MLYVLPLGLAAQHGSMGSLSGLTWAANWCSMAVECSTCIKEGLSGALSTTAGRSSAPVALALHGAVARPRSSDACA